MKAGCLYSPTVNQILVKKIKVSNLTSPFYSSFHPWPQLRGILRSWFVFIHFFYSLNHHQGERDLDMTLGWPLTDLVTSVFTFKGEMYFKVVTKATLTLISLVVLCTDFFSGSMKVKWRQHEGKINLHCQKYYYDLQVLPICIWNLLFAFSVLQV